MRPLSPANGHETDRFDDRYQTEGGGNQVEPDGESSQPLEPRPPRFGPAQQSRVRRAGMQGEEPGVEEAEEAGRVVEAGTEVVALKALRGEARSTN